MRGTVHCSAPLSKGDVVAKLSAPAPLHPPRESLPFAGKTTVAFLYGCVLKDLDRLSKGDVMLKPLTPPLLPSSPPFLGKTTVASLYGRILKDLGLLSKGDVAVKLTLLPSLPTSPHRQDHSCLPLWPHPERPWPAQQGRRRGQGAR